LGEHKRAILLVHVFIEAQPRPRTREQAGERRLTHSERVTPQVVTVQLDQVEGVEEDARVMLAIADAVEARDPVLAASDRLAVDDAGPQPQLSQRLDDEREAVSEIVARPAVEPHALAALAGDHPEAVMLDLMQPILAGRRLRSGTGKARRDEAGRQGTRGKGMMVQW